MKRKPCSSLDDINRHESSCSFNPNGPSNSVINGGNAFTRPLELNSGSQHALATGVAQTATSNLSVSTTTDIIDSDLSGLGNYCNVAI